MNEVAIKPTIQHFRLVQETEEKIGAFIMSFVKSKFIEAKDLLGEEKVRWIYFKYGSFDKCAISSEELVTKLNPFNYENKVYFIYPTVLYVDECDDFINNKLIRLYREVEWTPRILRNHIEFLEMVNDKIIVPIKRADFRRDDGSLYSSLLFLYNQEDLIKKYKLDLDYYETYFKEDLIDIRDIREQIDGDIECDRYLRTLFMMNKYGQPIPVAFKYPKYPTKGGEIRLPKIEVDEEYITIITSDYRGFDCRIRIDIKTNSTKDIKIKRQT